MTPGEIKVLIVVAAFVAAAAGGFGAGWTLNGWRLGKDLEAQKRETAVAVDQAKINKAAADSCTASVEFTQNQAREALKMAADYLQRALELGKKHLAASQAIEDLIKKGGPKSCHDAWQILEAMHKGAPAPGVP